MRIFNQLAYTDTPSEVTARLTPIIVGNGGNIQNPDGTVNLPGILARCDEALNDNAPLCLNIEYEPDPARPGHRRNLVCEPTSPNAQKDATAALFISALDHVHAHFPGLSVGVYAYWPDANYWDPAQSALASLPGDKYTWYRSNSSEFSRRLDLQLMHDQYMADQLARRVDWCFLSLYCSYTSPADQELWAHGALWSIKQARRFHKRVSAFVSPQLQGGRYPGLYIPVAFWQEQLELLADAHVDPVLWAGWLPGRQDRWNPAAEWWNVTEKFLD